MVCRTKIFWTVKRPGRPSNSCTCRYGATGGCKCVVARSACPHKSKKGEKRGGECRCDEQGRYCCLLEPDHWSALLALQKPHVEFFPNREALETKQAAAAMSMQHFSPSPMHTITSPSERASLPRTPGPIVHIPGPHIMPAHYAAFSPASRTLTPRFGLMGIGAPQGSHHDVELDVLAWDNNTPIPSREFQPQYADAQLPRGSCCQTPATTISHIASPQAVAEIPFIQPEPLHDLTLPQPYNGTGQVGELHGTILPSVLTPTQSSTYDFERLQADYYHYQFPNAICQNCGVSGCTCKNCPPPFQNPGTGSWAQCCSRKHAREPTPGAVPKKVQRSSNYDGTRGIHQHSQSQQLTGDCCGSSAQQELNGGQDPVQLDDGSVVPTDFDAFNLDHEFVMPDGSAPLNIADYLSVDLDADPPDDSQNLGGCCCRRT
ncbi:hypothetical protein CERZMDRAFT_82744 [Cercospora zeae-maydis SCOH1-5]|uniref:Copper-fist domain-containing protein n=1 Tax=Cercospora zeae-maydis SCOH1-5 TaxID=717836 RepID=A0A6A6FN00_9PEZI|nr:hypothetical protein CERZMDRAFT_82744 [Cercospora zeae-maydis SCOH1-5]